MIERFLTSGLRDTAVRWDALPDQLEDRWDEWEANAIVVAVMRRLAADDPALAATFDALRRDRCGGSARDDTCGGVAAAAEDALTLHGYDAPRPASRYCRCVPFGRPRRAPPVTSTGGASLRFAASARRGAQRAGVSPAGPEGDPRSDPSSTVPADARSTTPARGLPEVCQRSGGLTGLAGPDRSAPGQLPPPP
jgi:hypothetical protein